MEWRNRDWVWVVGILISIIIVIISIFFSSNKNLEVNFAIISSAVSIALALIAIFISLNQTKENQKLSTHMNSTMARIDEKINSVGEKMDKIDADVLFKIVQQKMENVSVEIEENISKKDDISVEELTALYSKELNEVKSELDLLLKKYMVNKIEYVVGDRTFHKKWGLGVVEEVYGSGDNTEIVVVFPEPYGRKKLFAKFAPIQKFI